MAKKITETKATKTVKPKKKTAYVCIGSFYTFRGIMDMDKCLRWFAAMSNKPMTENAFFKKYKTGYESELHDFECIEVTEANDAVYGFMTESYDFFIDVLNKDMTMEKAFKKITGEPFKYMAMSYKFKINFDEISA